MGPDRRLVGLIVAGLVFAGLAASAAAKGGVVVYAGNPSSVTKSVALKVVGKKGLKRLEALSGSVNDFFLHRVTIHVGQTVTFQIAGFHSVDLPPQGKGDLPFIVPNGTVSGADDAAGNPFWFNGKPSFGIDPGLFAPSGPKTYNGSARIDSGLPLGSGPPKPLRVTFTKAGTFKFFCDLHFGMTGIVIVKPKGKPVPTAAQNHAALVAQVKADILEAKALETAKVPKDTVHVGQAGPNGVELYTMYPARLTVKAGTVVTFTLSKAEEDTHTAAFGPSAYLSSLEINGPTIPGTSVYPSDRAQPLVLDPTSHGNGFANTGALSHDPSLGVPSLGKIKFTKPGTYQFICLIHPFTHGEIVVK
jgi:plastocyanin